MNSRVLEIRFFDYRATAIENGIESVSFLTLFIYIEISMKVCYVNAPFNEMWEMT